MYTPPDPRDDQYRDAPPEPEYTDWTDAEHGTFPEENADAPAYQPPPNGYYQPPPNGYYQQPEQTEGQPGQYPYNDNVQYGEAAPAGPSISIGSILSHTFSVFSKNPALFLTLGFLVVLPAVLLDAESIRSPGSKLLVQLGTNVVQLVFQGAMAYGVFQVLRSENAGLGDAIARGMSRILPLCGAAIILGIAKVIGYLLLVVPGIIMTCVWAVTIPACVVERLGASKSMDRSAELTRGNRWSIFGLFALIFTATVLLAMGVGFGVAGATGDRALTRVATAFITFIPQTFESIMCAVLYYDLRAAKEGVTVDSLANVFD